MGAPRARDPGRDPVGPGAAVRRGGGRRWLQRTADPPPPHAAPRTAGGDRLLALLIAQVILVEASLGFLGLGDPNAISLGYLASQAQGFLRVAWWLWFFPGAALILVVIGLNLVADAINDSLPPRR